MNWLQLLSTKRFGSEDKSGAKNILRSDFEVDYDRIIFSYPFRRLQDKTQVVPLPEYDFVHTRLTHSLEVSSVGRSLGKKIGEHVLNKYPEVKEAGYTISDFGAIVAAAALAHDIGNPPFGHSGEKALSSYFENTNLKFSDREKFDLLNFEGNAQGFRILLNDQLKLTYATLGAFTKYPCESNLTSKDKNRRSQKKYGFYQSEKNDFKFIANELGLISLSNHEITYTRHPLVYLVEAADDICYSLIDLEDAYQMKVITLNEFRDLVIPILGDKFEADKWNAMKYPNQKIGLLRALGIGKLVDECATVFIENESEILNGNFDTALADCIPSKKYTDEIGNFSVKRIYNSQRVLEIQAAGFEVLPGLVEIFISASEDYFLNGRKAKAKNVNTFYMLPDDIKDLIQDTSSTSYDRARKILDFVSGMTDKHAIELYKKLKGISL